MATGAALELGAASGRTCARPSSGHGMGPSAAKNVHGSAQRAKNLVAALGNPADGEEPSNSHSRLLF